MKPIRAVILVRVSTESQETDRQRNELTEEAKRRGWEIVEVIEEKISGLANGEDRVGLDRVRELVEQKKVDKVMVHEVSRIARRVGVVHTFVDWLTDEGVSLYWHSQSTETILPSGKRNAAASIMLAVLAEIARAEVETLGERVKSGMAAAKARGVHVGRPKGTEDNKETFLCRNRETVALMKRNRDMSIRDMAKLTGRSPTTITKLKRAMDVF
jgi:DNA invertase Pin-like site-specific DNA recombinase